MNLKKYFKQRNFIKEEDKRELIKAWKELKTKQEIKFQQGMFYLKTKEGTYVYDHKVFKRKIDWYQGGCKPSAASELQDGGGKGSKKHTKSTRRKTTV